MRALMRAMGTENASGLLLYESGPVLTPSHFFQS
jgi:hypothetical protein